MANLELCAPSSPVTLSDLDLKVKEILVSVKTDFKINTIIRDKEGP